MASCGENINIQVSECYYPQITLFQLRRGKTTDKENDTVFWKCNPFKLKTETSRTVERSLKAEASIS